MRNINTSFIETAICRFADEATQLLRAIANPATAVLRLVSSAIGALLGLGVPRDRLYPPFVFQQQFRLAPVSNHADFSRMAGKTGGTVDDPGFVPQSGYFVS